MKQWVFVCSVAALLVPLATTAARAQGVPAGVPIVVAASADFVTHQLVINGTGFGTAPVVRLGGAALTVVSATDTSIVADLPADIAAGSAMLLVLRKGVVPGVPFEVTIGAVGPKGDQGPIGPVGPVGPMGPVGPQGLQGVPGVVGALDQLRGVPCSYGSLAGQVSLTYRANREPRLKCVLPGEAMPADEAVAMVTEFVLPKGAFQRPPTEMLIELQVVHGGSLRGTTVSVGANAVTLPDIDAVDGDILIVHFEASETGTKVPHAQRHATTETNATGKTGCTDRGVCFAAAWDVEATLKASEEAVVAQVHSASGILLDAVPFTSVTADAIGAFRVLDPFSDAVQDIQSQGQWQPADCGGDVCSIDSTPDVAAISVNVRTELSVRDGPTAQRIDLSDHSAAAWTVARPTWGRPNQ